MADDPNVTVPATGPATEPTETPKDPSPKIVVRPTPWQPTLPVFIAVAALALIFAITTLIQMGAAGAARAAGERDVKKAQTEAAQQVKDANKAGLDRTAAAVAASIEPILALKQQVPEITDRTVQAICQGIIANPKYRFVAITDANGNVIASSDLALLGKPIGAAAQTEGAIESQAPIGQSGTSLGRVILRLQP